MAIVPNKDGMGIIANGATGVVDPSYCGVSRSGTGVPSIAPLYVGEQWIDTATGNLYRSYGMGTTQWVRLN